MTIDRLRSHYGFSRSPFGRDLAPQTLFPSRAHQEAVARISWLIAEGALGLLTGEVGSGKKGAAPAPAPPTHPRAPGLPALPHRRPDRRGHGLPPRRAGRTRPARRLDPRPGAPALGRPARGAPLP